MQGIGASLSPPELLAILPKVLALSMPPSVPRMSCTSTPECAPYLKQDPSFGGSKRAGCSTNNRGKAEPCYGYANGGPKQATRASILSMYSMQCGCVADRTRYSYSGCPACVSCHIPAALNDDE